ncbi:MAG: tRNA (adenosine(37)-N6)-threonylcarbamoyltransferase complex ATPase subunit type 1 TsaE [Selenomonadaceae bacterium]
MIQFNTSSPEATYALGMRLGEKIKHGVVLLLEGDLGAGKTLFVQGLAAGLHVAAPVTSPTFNLMNVYQGDYTMYHFDLYRLEQEAELEEIGFYEYSEDEDAVVIIEWPGKFPDCLPAENLHFTIRRGTDEQAREISVQLQGDKNRDIYEELEELCLF